MSLSFQKYFFLFLFLSSFFLSGRVSAFSLFPVRQTVTVDAGKSAQTFIDIKNESSVETEFQFDVEAFSIDEKTGHIQLGKLDTAIVWVHAKQQTKMLGAGQSQRVFFDIDVPLETQSGLHALALIATQKNMGGQVGINQRIASLLFLHVGGKIQEKVEIRNFSLKKNVAFGEPLLFDFRLQNIGNTYVVPEGDIVISSWWKKQLGSMKINLVQDKILPGESFERTQEIYDIPWYAVGKMTANFRLRYGVTAQEILVQKTFWYFSWKMVFLFIASCGFVFGLTLFSRKAKF